MMNKSTNWHHQIKSSKNSNTEVDVRIMEDEVIVKFVQHKQMLKGVNCLLLVSKALDELQLDLQHVAGGLIGDHYSYLLNSKVLYSPPFSTLFTLILLLLFQFVCL